MAWQLVYTSAPRLLGGGQTGFGTVAMHPQIRPALRQELERISTFSRVDGLDARRVIYCHRRISISAETFSVLSRISDCGADYTGRTNHIAHHVVVTESDPRPLNPFELIATLESHDLWLTHWDQPPAEFGINHEIQLSAFPPFLRLPAETWAQFLGDAGKAAVLAPGPGTEACWILHPPTLKPAFLHLLGEAALLHPDPWRITFTNDLQPTDRSDELAWRGVPVESPLRGEAARSVRPTIDLSSPAGLVPDPAFAHFARTGTRLESAPAPRSIRMAAPSLVGVAGETAREPAGSLDSPQPRLQELRGRKQAGASKPSQAVWIAAAATAGIILIVGLIFGFQAFTEARGRDDLIKQIRSAQRNNPIFPMPEETALKSQSREVLLGIKNLYLLTSVDLENQSDPLRAVADRMETSARQERALNEWLNSSRTEWRRRRSAASIQQRIRDGALEDAHSEYRNFGDRDKLNEILGRHNVELLELWEAFGSSEVEPLVEKVSRFTSLTKVDKAALDAIDARLTSVVKSAAESGRLKNPSARLPSIPYLFAYTKFLEEAKPAATPTPPVIVETKTKPQDHVPKVEHPRVQWVANGLLSSNLPSTSAGDFVKGTILTQEQIWRFFSGEMLQQKPRDLANPERDLVGASGVLVTDPDGKQRLLLSDSLIDKHLRSGDGRTVEVTSRELWPSYDPETRIMAFPEALEVRLFSKMPDGQNAEIRWKRIDRGTGEEKSLSSAKIDLSGLASLPGNGPQSIEDLNNEQKNLKTQWQKAAKIWNQATDSRVEEEMPDLLPKRHDLVASLVERLRLESRKLAENKSSAGSQDRAKEAKSLDQLANNLVDERRTPDRVKGDIASAIEKVGDLTKGEDRKNRTMEPDHAASFLLFDAENWLKKIRRTEVALKESRATVEADRLFLADPVPKVELLVIHGGQPFLRFQFTSTP